MQQSLADPVSNSQGPGNIGRSGTGDFRRSGASDISRPGTCFIFGCSQAVSSCFFSSGWTG